MPDQQLERLKQAAGVTTDTALASYLGIKQGSISGAKSRGRIPAKWFLNVAQKSGRSVEWLKNGIQPVSPIYNGMEQPEGNCLPNAPQPKVSELLAKTAEVLESGGIYQTALTSNIEAFHNSVVMETRLKATEAKMDETQDSLEFILGKIGKLERENEQLREEMQRDRDQAAVDDTG